MEVPFTPIDFIRRARKLYGSREAVVDGERRFSYEQFLSRCYRWSVALAKLGVGKGDRVATLAPNTHQHLEQFYAVPQLGAIVVPLNYRLVAEDFVYLVNHSGTKVLCAHADYLDVVDRVRDRMETVEHFVALEGHRQGWLSYEELIEASDGKVQAAVVEESDLLTINYTSGTTSNPKGVMITHRNAWTNVVGTLVHLPMTPADRYLWTLPMFHANGWTYTWIVTAVGATHVCLRHIDASTVYRLVNDERITLLCAAPTVLIALANAPSTERKELRRGVRVVTAGAPPAAATIERMEVDLGWNITQVYGLTETAPFISICEPLPEHEGVDIAGRTRIKARQGVELITSGELRVVDEHMRDVPADGSTLGEIVTRGNVVMKGYYNDPEATAIAFRGGYFHTGDAAVMHPDGYIEIRDRKKDMIISGGENISSIEVEGALMRHPAVLEVAVVGMPHEKWGESPHAFVVLRPGGSVTAPILREYARGVMAHFKVPTAFTFVESLPKTATGKIQKYVLRAGRSAIAKQ
jgi:fatty-acyl-CoA synthase